MVCDSFDHRHNIYAVDDRQLLGRILEVEKRKECRMEFKAGKVFAMALAGIVGMACCGAVAKGKSSAVHYPAALKGIWLGENEDCKNPDSLDSDARFEITPAKLIGYEHWNKPLRIVQISKVPMAWKVVSRTYFDGASVELEEIYVLSGHQNRYLTVVNIDQSNTYGRCQ
ncbi:hypothetical protein ASE43_13935 [Lysobacter sp. Root983]|nr:hypothetical protein ASE43_13935 [Lysobacter sp. Root983]